mgnify:CR=1 FL=1
MGWVSAMWLAGFNPTLVRLRRTTAAGATQAFSRFNPTLVRLRLEAPGGVRVFVIKFQSHAGSIEAKAHPPPLSQLFVVSIPRWFD